MIFHVSCTTFSSIDSALLFINFTVDSHVLTHQKNIIFDDVHDMFRYLWHRCLMTFGIDFSVGSFRFPHFFDTVPQVVFLKIPWLNFGSLLVPVRGMLQRRLASNI